MTARIAVKSIKLERAEGTRYECDGPHTVLTWAQAKSLLFRWSMTAPRTGGYNKCDFKVTWEDGRTHDGRFDLMHHTIEYPNLARHVRNFLECYALRYVPAQYSTSAEMTARFRRHIHETMTAEEITECGHVLDSYDLDTGETEQASPSLASGATNDNAAVTP